MVSAEAIALRDVVRGKDPLGSLCKQRLITPEACDWVKSALDPFHDLQLDNLRGYPDVSTEPTVIVKVRQAKTISRPPGLDQDANWDCHIVLSPIDYAPGSGGTTPNDGVVIPALSQPAAAGGSADTCAGRVTLQDTYDPANTFYCHRMDGLVVNSVPSEENSFTPTHMPRTGVSGYETQHINLDNYMDYDDTDLGVYRIVYSGFEVVNTTAQIAKQGAVTVYEYGNSFETGASQPSYQAASGTFVTAFPKAQPTTYFRCPPNTLAEAKIMPGSHSWAAQDGCYNTAKFQTDNPFQGLTKRPWIIQQNNPVSANANGYVLVDGKLSGGSFASDFSLGVESTSLGAGDLPATHCSGPAHFTRMNTSGAYFTGLSYDTTLFVTWRVGIERLPAANKPTFLALAQPSALYDPSALVLYNLVANALPPGCPQGYNDAGKWFRWISEQAGKAIPRVYPVVRTAAMVADSMLGKAHPAALALGGMQAMLKPKAEQIAAARMQKAARAMSARKAPRNTRGRGNVGNWQQPTARGGRPGGRNGLG
jgi:predicted phage tail protein